LARRLGPRLGLPVIDKDDILERIFEERGMGDSAWRRKLSRESDGIFEREALASTGALLVSFWHADGMAVDSGTPTEWLARLPGCVVNVHCVCASDVAARRFLERQRHPGHLDAGVSQPVSVDFARLSVGSRIEVDTSGDEPVLDALVNQISIKAQTEKRPSNR
jgi:hypothetical protein